MTASWGVQGEAHESEITDGAPLNSSMGVLEADIDGGIFNEEVTNTEERTYTVVGFYDRPGYALSTAAGMVGVTAGAAAPDAFTDVFLTLNDVTNTQQVEEAAEALFPDEHVVLHTAMLRYMGVPARYVEGYYLSAEDAARYKAGETITLTEENAHAWAEYYVSGVGFVPFEVTPGYIDDEELSLGGDSPDENTYENNTQQFVEVEQPEEVNEHKQDRFTFSLNAHYLLLLPLLLILLLAGCIFHRRRVFRKKMAAIDAANDREAIAMRYGYAVCLLRHSTVQFSEDAAEAAELNQKALFSTQEMTPQQRKQVDSFAVRVLDACKGSWTTWEKIRYRLWNCLY
jgi:hypothetical protein